MNPIATILMNGQAQIVIELLPETAPNTVNSFLQAAACGWYDGVPIERIVPGDWIDCSYTAFGKDACKYMIPNEAAAETSLSAELPVFGSVCMGGYPDGISGCEFFFPLRECPNLKGRFPVFGRVTEGLEELRRIEHVETVPVPFPDPKVVINRPVCPEIITRVDIQWNGFSPAPPVKLQELELPLTWREK